MSVEMALETGFQELCRVGVALSVERDIDKLLEMIVSVARRYTNAEGGTLYLCNEEKACLDFSVVQNEKLEIYQIGPERDTDWPSVPLYLPGPALSRSENHHNASAHCALTGQTVIIHDVYHEQGFDFSSTRIFDQAAGYRSRSMLLVPMQDKQGECIGVLQLLNSRSVRDGSFIDFPPDAVAMVQGLASQASISVVNIRLINRLKEFTRLAVALSAEKNLYALLEMVVTMARRYTRAEGCTVFLRNEERKSLDMAVIQNEALDIFKFIDEDQRNWPSIPLFLEDGSENHRNASAHCVLTRKIVAIRDIYSGEGGFDFHGTREFDARFGYHSQSMLLVPMTDHEDEVIGVLQLINARRGISMQVTDFSENDIELVSGLASQAAVAVTNVRLVKGMEKLLQSFVQCIAAAIDEKSPYTAGHIQRVAKLTMMMTQGISATQTGPLAEISFSEEQMEEIDLAAWMHDIGKITTPEQIVDKATKLEAIADRIELFRLRLELIRKERELGRLRADVGILRKRINRNDDTDERTKTTGSDADDDDLDSIFQFVQQVNMGGEFMRDEDLAEIKRIAAMPVIINGEEEPLLTDNELECCSIRRGTLTERERQIINHHVTVSITMLESLPFLKKWAKVPLYAGMHHEKLDGSGYPQGKKSEEIPLPARILAVADVFEALTAADRPYKLGKTLSEAMRIMGFMVKDDHLDASLCDFLVESGIVHRYAHEYLSEQQRDRFLWNGVQYSPSP